jgi:hypothetical protein
MVLRMTERRGGARPRGTPQMGRGESGRSRGPNIRVDVDEIILHGAERQVGKGVGEAFRQELERILAGMDSDRLRRRDVDLVTLEMERRRLGESPQVWGTRLARAVARSLGAGPVNGRIERRR